MASTSGKWEFHQCLPHSRDCTTPAMSEPQTKVKAFPVQTQLSYRLKETFKFLFKHTNLKTKTSSVLWEWRGVRSLYYPTADTRWVKGNLISHRKITALGFRHWSQRCKSLVESPKVSSASRLRLHGLYLSSSLGLASAFPPLLHSLNWRDFGVCALPPPSCTSFLANLSL